VPLAFIFGLGAALCWGTADFFGGLLARRLPTLVVVFWSQLAGGVSVWLLLLGLGQRPEWTSVVWGMGAGLFGGSALLCFYRGLAVGAMSIVAPIAASGAVVPVVVALLRGELPTAPVLLGVLVAIVGIVLVSLPSGSTLHPSGRPGLVLLLALGAALGFGMFFVVVDQGVAEGGAPLWVVAGTRLGSLPMLALLIVLSQRPFHWPGRRLIGLVPVGLLDTTANACFAFATTLGNLGVVSVLSSLYPVATVLLARLVLAERLARTQSAGVVLALAGVALMSAG
jgi:drug/metabolite transporter (DMT)-like permease